MYAHGVVYSLVVHQCTDQRKPVESRYHQDSKRILNPREDKSMADSSKELTDQVKRQMNQPQIHESWEKVYRTTENEQFFEQAYDDFVKRIDQQPGSRALDIGCGICANSIRLARRGYIVSAADYSEP